MVSSHVWHVWPARHWPASVQEEHTFFQDLTAAADTAEEPYQSDGDDEQILARAAITAVLNALRCGLTAAELLDRVPGTHPTQLRNAYQNLDTRRRRAVAAWYRIVQAPNDEPSPEDMTQAGLVLPAALHRLRTTARLTTRGWPARQVLTYDREVAAQVWIARQVESALSARTPPDQQAVEIGNRLHHPWQPALWSAAFYLPRRVTDLSSARVADLLHERSSRE